MPGGLRLAGEFPSATLATFARSLPVPLVGTNPARRDIPLSLHRPLRGTPRCALGPPYRAKQPQEGGAVRPASRGRSGRGRAPRGSMRRIRRGGGAEARSPSRRDVCGTQQSQEEWRERAAVRVNRTASHERSPPPTKSPGAAGYRCGWGSLRSERRGVPKFLGTSLFLGLRDCTRSDHLRPASFWRAFSAAGDFGYLDRRSS
jgi:hypothetical protein